MTTHQKEASRATGIPRDGRIGTMNGAQTIDRVKADSVFQSATSRRRQCKAYTVSGTSLPASLMNQPRSKRRKAPITDEWDQQWRKHWSKVGLPGYELPVGGPGGDERDFLATARTLAKEKQRLKRINDEFTRAFKALHDETGRVRPGRNRLRPHHRLPEGSCGADRARAAIHRARPAEAGVKPRNEIPTVDHARKPNHPPRPAGLPSIP